MTDTRGLHSKFTVTRNDGTDTPGGKHHGCRYFVLDIDHDSVALDVLPALAEGYEFAGRYELAADLRRLHVDATLDDPQLPQAAPRWTQGWMADGTPVFLRDGRGQPIEEILAALNQERGAVHTRLRGYAADPDKLADDISAQIHLQFGDDGTNDEHNDWVAGLVGLLMPLFGFGDNAARAALGETDG